MSDLLQVLVDTSLTVTHTFRVDGTAIDVDSGLPTLTAIYPDSTALSPVPTVSNSWSTPTPRTTGQYRFVLDAQPEVTWLDYELTGTIGGKTQRLKGRVEWVGALLFTLEELRNHPVTGSVAPFTDTTKYPNEKLLKVRAEVLGEFTKRLRFSPVPRFEYETHDIEGPRSVVILKRHYPIRVLQVSVAGVAQTVGNYRIGKGGMLLPVSGYAASGWTSYGYDVVAVGYVHGWDTFEDDQGKEAALLRASMKLAPGLSSTMASYASEAGSFTWDRAGSRNAAGEKVHFGVGAIAEWINEHALPGLGVG